MGVFEEAASCQCLSENMSLKWLLVLTECGQSKESLSRALDVVLSLHPTSLAVLQAVLQHYVSLQRPYRDVYRVFTECVTKIHSKESLPLWDIIHNWLKESHPDKLEPFLQRGLTECAEVSVPVKLWYLEFASTQGNISKVRDVYKRITAFPPLDVQIFQTYINIEINQDKVDMRKVRSAYESAIREFGGSSTELWLAYIRCELEHPEGQPQRVGDLYTKAVKTLDGELNERFVTQYTLLQTGHL